MTEKKLALQQGRTIRAIGRALSQDCYECANNQTPLQYIALYLMQYLAQVSLSQQRIRQ